VGSDKPREHKSRTETTEYGSFIRKKTRYGKKRKQKTVILKKNPEKVVLGKIGDIEVYVYPFQYPDKIFFGLFPMSCYLEEHQKEDVLVLYNRIRWFFKEDWTKKRKQTKHSKASRQAILKAYNVGLDKLKKANLDRDSLN